MGKERSAAAAALGSALLVLLAALPAALLVDAKSAWYVSLDKPVWTPPGWAFAAVWSAVYLCAAAALYPLLRASRSPGPRGAAALLCAGLLNVLWTGGFFRLHAVGGALFALVLLLLALGGACAALYRRGERRSACLLLPHVLWGAFALALNLSIFLRNRT